jgi:hypothetical protein
VGRRSPRPLIIEFHLCNPFLFGSMNSMKPVFGDQPLKAQKQFYAGAEFRRSFGEELKRRTIFHDIWDRAQIKGTTNPALKPLEWNRRRGRMRTRPPSA